MSRARRPGREARRAIGVVALALSYALSPGAAIACDPIGYPSDRERLAAELEAARHASAAIDGVVMTDGYEVGSTAIIKPTRIWFGPRQAEYRVRKTTMCGADLTKGERVRLSLHRLPPDNGLIASLRRIVQRSSPTYESSGFSGFSWAMRYPAMRRLVLFRARADARRVAGK